MWEKIPRYLHYSRTAAEDPADAVLVGHLSSRMANPAAGLRPANRMAEMFKSGDSGEGGLAMDMLNYRWPRSVPANSARRRFSAWASCPTFRPPLSSSCLAAFIRRWRSSRKKAKAAGRRSTNTRATPRCCFVLVKVGPSMGFLCRPSGYGQHRLSSLTRRMPIVEFSSSWQLDRRVITMTAGTVFLMWLGEQIDEYGIGNGISSVDHGRASWAQMVAGTPFMKDFIGPMRQARPGIELGSESRPGRALSMIVVLMAMFVRSSWFSAWCSLARVSGAFPTQSAKHVRGRRVYGGARGSTCPCE